MTSIPPSSTSSFQGDLFEAVVTSVNAHNGQLTMRSVEKEVIPLIQRKWKQYKKKEIKQQLYHLIIQQLGSYLSNACIGKKLKKQIQDRADLYSEVQEGIVTGLSLPRLAKGPMLQKVLKKVTTSSSFEDPWEIISPIVMESFSALTLPLQQKCAFFRHHYTLLGKTELSPEDRRLQMLCSRIKNLGDQQLVWERKLYYWIDTDLDALSRALEPQQEREFTSFIFQKIAVFVSEKKGYSWLDLLQHYAQIDSHIKIRLQNICKFIRLYSFYNPKILPSREMKGETFGSFQEFVVEYTLRSIEEAFGFKLYPELRESLKKQAIESVAFRQDIAGHFWTRHYQDPKHSSFSFLSSVKIFDHIISHSEPIPQKDKERLFYWICERDRKVSFPWNQFFTTKKASMSILELCEATQFIAKKVHLPLNKMCDLFCFLFLVADESFDVTKFVPVQFLGIEAALPILFSHKVREELKEESPEIFWSYGIEWLFLSVKRRLLKSSPELDQRAAPFLPSQRIYSHLRQRINGADPLILDEVFLWICKRDRAAYPWEEFLVAQNFPGDLEKAILDTRTIAVAIALPKNKYFYLFLALLNGSYEAVSAKKSIVFSDCAFSAIRTVQVMERALNIHLPSKFREDFLDLFHEKPCNFHLETLFFSLNPSLIKWPDILDWSVTPTILRSIFVFTQVANACSLSKPVEKGVLFVWILESHGLYGLMREAQLFQKPLSYPRYTQAVNALESLKKIIKLHPKQNFYVLVKLLKSKESDFDPILENFSRCLDSLGRDTKSLSDEEDCIIASFCRLLNGKLKVEHFDLMNEFIEQAALTISLEDRLSYLCELPMPIKAPSKHCIEDCRRIVLALAKHGLDVDKTVRLYFLFLLRNVNSSHKWKVDHILLNSYNDCIDQLKTYIGYQLPPDQLYTFLSVEDIEKLMQALKELILLKKGYFDEIEAGVVIRPTLYTKVESSLQSIEACLLPRETKQVQRTKNPLSKTLCAPLFPPVDFIAGCIKAPEVYKTKLANFITKTEKTEWFFDESIPIGIGGGWLTFGNYPTLEIQLFDVRKMRLRIIRAPFEFDTDQLEKEPKLFSFLSSLASRLLSEKVEAFSTLKEPVSWEKFVRCFPSVKKQMNDSSTVCDKTALMEQIGRFFLTLRKQLRSGFLELITGKRRVEIIPAGTSLVQMAAKGYLYKREKLQLYDVPLSGSTSITSAPIEEEKKEISSEEASGKEFLGSLIPNAMPYSNVIDCFFDDEIVQGMSRACSFVQDNETQATVCEFKLTLDGDVTIYSYLYLDSKPRDSGKLVELSFRYKNVLISIKQRYSDIILDDPILLQNMLRLHFLMLKSRFYAMAIKGLFRLHRVSTTSSLYSSSSSSSEPPSYQFLS